MSLRVDRQTIMQEEFDSGSLTPLCSIVHFVQQTGLYIGKVTHGKNVVGTFRIEAVGDGAPRQTNVDLAMIRGTGDEARLVLAPGGVVFYASSGAIGYAVKLWRADGGRRKLEFDSQKLGAEDLFTVTLLHPGNYEVADESGRSLHRLHVGARKPGKNPYRAPAPAIAALSEKAPDDAEKLSQTQTQVFRAEGHSRITVRLAKADRAPGGPASKKAEWRRDPG